MSLTTWIKGHIFTQVFVDRLGGMNRSRREKQRIFRCWTTTLSRHGVRPDDEPLIVLYRYIAGMMGKDFIFLHLSCASKHAYVPVGGSALTVAVQSYSEYSTYSWKKEKAQWPSISISLYVDIHMYFTGEVFHESLPVVQSRKSAWCLVLRCPCKVHITNSVNDDLTYSTPVCSMTKGYGSSTVQVQVQ